MKDLWIWEKHEHEKARGVLSWSVMIGDFRFIIAGSVTHPGSYFTMMLAHDDEGEPMSASIGGFAHSFADADKMCREQYKRLQN